jgi:hypothetical protein
VVASNEVFVYVFDPVPMLVVVVGFLVLYPSRLVREVGRLESIDLKAAGAGEMTELRGGSRGSYPVRDSEVRIRSGCQKIRMMLQTSRMHLET